MILFASRQCFLAPIPEIANAALLLNEAVNAHVAGHPSLVEDLLRQANMPVIRAWTESIWGKKSSYVNVQKELATLTKTGDVVRVTSRMPDVAMQRLLHVRDGFHCRFCGIPVIRAQVRKRFVKLYPHLKLWGKTNAEQHAAFQAMWVQYDHVIPHSKGGANDLSNIVITCAPCNFGKMEYTIKEVGLEDPMRREPKKVEWDGLERFLSSSLAFSGIP